MTTKTFGQSVARVEDPALLRGKARFIGDIRLDGMLHAAFLRSPHAHARIRAIDVSRALAMPGVNAVLTAPDIRKYVTTDRLVVALPDKTIVSGATGRSWRARRQSCRRAHRLAIAETPYRRRRCRRGAQTSSYEPLPAAADCRDALAQARRRTCGRRG